MVKTDLENTHRERHFVHGAVTVEWLYFATVMQDNNIQGKQKGKTEKKNVLSEMDSNLIPNSAFFKHLPDLCGFPWNHEYIKITGKVLVRIEEYEKQTRL